MMMFPKMAMMHHDHSEYDSSRRVAYHIDYDITYFKWLIAVYQHAWLEAKNKAKNLLAYKYICMREASERKRSKREREEIVWLVWLCGY